MKPVFIIAVISTMAFTSSAKADLPLTNEQFVSNSISKEVVVFLDSIKIAPSPVKFEKSEGLNNLAVDAVKAAMIKRGWSVNDRLSDNTLVVNLTLSAFEFKYEKGGSRGLFKKPHIKRMLSGQLLLNISGSGYNNVSFLNFSDTDKVLPQHENYVASIRYNELTPEVSFSGIERYLEPLAVTATVGGLIYLFFVNR